jgi:Txe/YoeB family toxin of toxin-antitoxin system
MKKIWFDEAWDDYLYWQGQDKKTLKRINAILKDIERKGGFEEIGKPEPLQGELSIKESLAMHRISLRRMLCLFSTVMKVGLFSLARMDVSITY